MDEERVRREMTENLPPPDLGVGLARSVVGQGLGMGFGDEGEAWVRSKLGQGSYEDLQRSISKEYGRFADYYPVSSGVGEFVGGAAPSVAALMMAPATGGASLPAAAASGTRAVGALSRIASNPYTRSMGVGTLQGGISGAGTAEQDERLSGAGTGAIMGGAIGTSFPVIARGAQSGLGWLEERTLPKVYPGGKTIEDRALAKISGALKSSDPERNMEPADIYKKMYDYEQKGFPSMVSNTSEGLTDLADYVAQKSGSAARIMQEPLERQITGSRDRVMGQVRETMGTRGDYFGQDDRLAVDLRTKAKPYYDAAYAHGEVKDPEVLKYMERPQFKDALALYEKSLEAKGQKLPTVPVLDASGKKIGERVAPTVEILDQVKRNLDDLIDKQTDSLTKKKTTLGESYIDEKNSFLEAFDNAVPDYKNARKIFGGYAEVRDALNMGMNDFGKLKSEQITRTLEGFGSEAEREAFRTGSDRWIQSYVMGPSSDANFAKRIINSPEMAAKMQAVSDSPAKFDFFKSALELESKLVDEAARSIKGIQGQRGNRLNQQFGDDTNIRDAAINVATGGGFINSLSSMAGRMSRSASITDEVAQKISKMLSSQSPREVAAAVKLIEDFDARQAVKARRFGAAETGTVGGTVVALPSSPDSGEQSEGNDYEAITSRIDRKTDTLEADVENILKSRRGRQGGGQ
jgi:hypothetical protein